MKRKNAVFITALFLLLAVSCDWWGIAGSSFASWNENLEGTSWLFEEDLVLDDYSTIFVEYNYDSEGKVINYNTKHYPFAKGKRTVIFGKKDKNSKAMPMEVTSEIIIRPDIMETYRDTFDENGRITRHWPFFTPPTLLGKSLQRSNDTTTYEYRNMGNSLLFSEKKEGKLLLSKNTSKNFVYIFSIEKKKKAKFDEGETWETTTESGREINTVNHNKRKIVTHTQIRENDDIINEDPLSPWVEVFTPWEDYKIITLRGEKYLSIGEQIYKKVK